MSNNLALVKKDVVDVVSSKVQGFVKNGELHLPPNYSVENAMKSAWLILQNTVNKDKRPVLEVCSKDSIANALLDMAVQGLNPAKKQGYFIAYGKQLTFQRSYFGTMAVTKRVTGAKEINAYVIYEDDEVEYELKNAKIVNLVHKQKFGNINKDKIAGAYATIIMPDENVYYEVMTMDEIRMAWKKSQMWGKDQDKERKGSTHDEYRQEMAKKTVINRACKRFLNSSDDGSLLVQYINRADEVAAEAEVEAEIEENANQELIDIEYEIEEDVAEEKPAEKSQEQPQEQKQEQKQKGQQITMEGPGF